MDNIYKFFSDLRGKRVTNFASFKALERHLLNFPHDFGRVEVYDTEEYENYYSGDIDEIPELLETFEIWVEDGKVITA